MPGPGTAAGGSGDGEYSVAVFTQDKNPTEQSDVTNLDPLYKGNGDEIVIPIPNDSTEDIKREISEMYSNDTLIKWGEGGSNGKEMTETDDRGNTVVTGREYHFSAYTPVFTKGMPTSTVIKYQRSVTFNMDWDNGFITTMNPDTETSGQ